MREFWNSLLTDKSWKELINLNKEYDFVLIGGWAVYLLTKQIKSRDIDIVIGFEELEKIRRKEDLSKNDRLKKYEIKRGQIDIDIYVKNYSELAALGEIGKYTMKTQGFEIPNPSFLLVLKQQAYQNRKNTVKGEKDSIDILSLLFFSDIDFEEYSEILKEYNMESYIDNLLKVVRSFEDYNSLGLEPQEMKKRKKRVVSNLKDL